MTQPEPNGMGRPVPDTVNNNPANHGNGKIDIFVLYSRLCVDPNCPLGVKDGKLKLGVARQLPTTLGAPGHPPTSTSGYIIVNAVAIAGIQSKPTIAHEFFHVLQMAHNRKAWYGSTSRGPESEASWYVEASAQWAGWYYAQDPDAYTYFSNHFQQDNLSLLEASNSNQHLYHVLDMAAIHEHRIGATRSSRAGKTRRTQPLLSASTTR